MSQSLRVCQEPADFSMHCALIWLRAPHSLGGFSSVGWGPRLFVVLSSAWLKVAEAQADFRSLDGLGLWVWVQFRGQMV